VGRPGLEPGTTGLKVHWEFNGDSSFQHPPSPILARFTRPSRGGRGVSYEHFRPKTRPPIFRATRMQQCEWWHPTGLSLDANTLGNRSVGELQGKARGNSVLYREVDLRFGQRQEPVGFEGE
jgi:hypothetical protein